MPGNTSDPTGAQSAFGLIVGLVTDLADPENLGRVRVKYPTLGDTVSNWAWIVTPMSGSEYGAFFRPEVNDLVLVGFEQGETRRPFVLGSLWNGKQKPPPDATPQQNDLRMIKSRSGHIIKLNDEDGAETVEIIDKASVLKIVLDSAGKIIKITNDGGDIEVTASNGSVKVNAMTIEIKATGNMDLEAQGNMTLKATGNVDLEATGNMTVKGAMVSIN